MAAAQFDTKPTRTSYDVVIVGGAIYGSSVAWWLTENPDFDGTILVIERDPRYEKCATAHTNSCIRQQFSNALNVQISQFGAQFIKGFREHMGSDPRVPDLSIHNFGYMYLANTDAFADTLRASHKVQVDAGAGTQLLSADDIKAAYPFYAVDDIKLGSINTVDEGYWDGGAVFEWWRRSARERGVEYIAGEVIGMSVSGGRVQSVTLGSGDVVACGQVVNATGPRGAKTAKMAGIDIPIEPRKRFTWVFSAEQPLDRDLPLTIDPSGVHFRQDGPQTYIAGGQSDPDPAVDFDDFAMDADIWQDKIWPTIAARIPQFEAIKVITEWAGHYDYNTLDHNAILGPHPDVTNFYFVNGFSGHGLQQSPAMGRGTAEMLVHGAYQTLDLSAFGYERIAAGVPFQETAVI